MGVFYGTKIILKEVNPKTEKVWTLNDVPNFWKSKVETWLTNN